MSRLRWALFALLAFSSVLFAVGVSLERSTEDAHVESTVSAEGASGTVEGEEGAHDEAAEAAQRSSGEAGEAGHVEADAEAERFLGVDLESTLLVVLAVIAGLGFAVLAATTVGTMRGFLVAVLVVALLWAVMDVREVAHQLEESRAGIAVIAAAVAALHLLAAAVAGRLAGRSQQSS